MSGGFESSQQQQKRSVRTVRTLLISQILNSQLETDDGPVTVDDHPVDQAVLCGHLTKIEDTGTAKRLDLNDTTGATEIRLSNQRAGDVEALQDQEVLVYGYFRVFNGKQNFEASRVVGNLKPYTSMYHEIEAAREYYNYAGIVTLDNSLKRPSQAPAANNEKLFVEDSDAMKVRIMDIIRGHDDGMDGAQPEALAHELSMSQPTVEKLLQDLTRDAVIYEVEGVYRISS